MSMGNKTLLIEITSQSASRAGEQESREQIQAKGHVKGIPGSGG